MGKDDRRSTIHGRASYTTGRTMAGDVKLHMRLDKRTGHKDKPNSSQKGKGSKRAIRRSKPRSDIGPLPR